jgi:small conductance mechanosensitive channel
LSHPDRSRVVIPNRRIVGEILHNYGRIRQLQVKVGVAYDADLDQACATIREVLESNSRVLKDPAPIVGVASFGESGVTIGGYPWTQVSDFGSAGDEVHRAILEAFRARGIVIPLPRHEVRMLDKAA